MVENIAIPAGKIQLQGWRANQFSAASGARAFVVHRVCLT
jgi:hypothetical protein